MNNILSLMVQQSLSLEQTHNASGCDVACDLYHTLGSVIKQKLFPSWTEDPLVRIQLSCSERNFQKSEYGEAPRP